jgi:hypothetical protein
MLYAAGATGVLDTWQPAAAESGRGRIKESAVWHARRPSADHVAGMRQNMPTQRRVDMSPFNRTKDLDAAISSVAFRLDLAELRVTMSDIKSANLYGGLK